MVRQFRKRSPRDEFETVTEASHDSCQRRERPHVPGEMSSHVTCHMSQTLYVFTGLAGTERRGFHLDEKACFNRIQGFSVADFRYTLILLQALVLAVSFPLSGEIAFFPIFGVSFVFLFLYIGILKYHNMPSLLQNISLIILHKWFPRFSCGCRHVCCGRNIILMLKLKIAVVWVLYVFIEFVWHWLPIETGFGDIHPRVVMVMMAHFNFNWRYFNFNWRLW